MLSFLFTACSSLENASSASPRPRVSRPQTFGPVPPPRRPRPAPGGLQLNEFDGLDVAAAAVTDALDDDELDAEHTETLAWLEEARTLTPHQARQLARCIYQVRLRPMPRMAQLYGLRVGELAAA